MFDALPSVIQEIAQDKYLLFLANPHDPALHDHPLTDGGRGRHRNGSRSVRITQQYRAIYVVEDGVNIWYWTGTHSSYNLFTGRN